MLGSDHSAFSRGLPLTWLAWLARGLLTAALALGCTPQIGDKCTVSTNCSTTGDRLCDVTQPDGYCTKFNCEPGSCPEDSVCVNFGTTLSIIDDYAGSCSPSQGNSPYKRSFCMANCSSDSDCRSGYACLAAEQMNAVLAEHNSSQRVCAVKPGPEPMANPDGSAGAGNSDEVCIGSDAGPSSGGSSAIGGSGGASGGAAGGASSVGGASGDGGATDGGAAGDGGTGG
jgi:hypothetical protein